MVVGFWKPKGEDVRYCVSFVSTDAFGGDRLLFKHNAHGCHPAQAKRVEGSFWNLQVEFLLNGYNK